MTEATLIPKYLEIYNRIISRRDVWAQQNTTPNDKGKHKYLKTQTALTDDLLKISILNQSTTIGVYTINPNNNTVTNPQIDIDNHDGTVEIATVAKKIYDWLKANGMYPYIEGSSGRVENGAHVGLICKPTPVADAREFLCECLKELGLNSKKYEVFPKQDKITSKDFGNLVKLPFQYNNRSKARSLIINPETMLPFFESDAIEFMLKLKDSNIPKGTKIETVNTEQVKEEKHSENKNNSGLAEYLKLVRHCFREVYNQKIPLHGAGGHGHNFRHAAACELIAREASDVIIHEYFSVQSDYDKDETQKQLNQIRSTGYKPYKCDTIKELCNAIVIGNKLCDNCMFENIRKNSKKEDRPNFKEQLLKYMDVMELFHDSYKEAHARIKVDNEHHTILSTKSKDFKRWLANECYKDTGESPTTSAITDALNTIEGKAVFNGEMHDLQVRACMKNGVLWYDIGNNEAVKITPGHVELIKDVPTLFKQYQHMKAYDNVVLEGDAKKLLDFVNIKRENDKILFMTIAISYMIPNISRPAMGLYGTKGGAKSTAQKMLKSIIDPSIIQILKLPKIDNELLQQLAHHYFAPYDNLSGITQTQSDIFCCAITGVGVSKRTLYTDDDDMVYNFIRAVSYNGINAVATQSDLMDRTVGIEVEPINDEDRKSDVLLWNDFNAAKPIILGGFFQVISKAMEIYPTIKLPRISRMADYCVWGCAIAEALGYGKDKFLEAYEENIALQNQEALRTSLIGPSIVKFMDDKPEWKGEPDDFYNEWWGFVKTNFPTILSDKNFPKASNRLSNSINRLVLNLKA
ncbi:MAG TPA: hypothetical protein VN368_03695, partial [Candidatus Methylomirabilis sp.]|nr:hypothetical protein [Candidatus Methylomirabilis sp.]